MLINNAGVTRDNMLFKMTEADWDMVMNVHLRGAFLMTRAVQKHMIEAKWGRIVNLSSVSALGNRGQANYSTAKAGLQGFTKTLAIELGKFGVTANAIAPGFIETEMTKATAERMGIPFDDFISARRRRSRSPASASPRTSRTWSRSSSARGPGSSPARSSTPPAAPAPDEGPPAPRARTLAAARAPPSRGRSRALRCVGRDVAPPRSGSSSSVTPSPTARAPRSTNARAPVGRRP